MPCYIPEKILPVHGLDISPRCSAPEITKFLSNTKAEAEEGLNIKSTVNGYVPE